jgi:hypothetical protein
VNKDLIYLSAMLVAILVIGWLFSLNLSSKSDLSGLIDRSNDKISHFSNENKKLNNLINDQKFIIDSLEKAYQEKKEIIINYTHEEKQEYFKDHSLDSTKIILINEERLTLIEINKIQKKEIQLLKTVISNKDSIINSQSDIIKYQEIENKGLQKDIKKLKFQNTVLKIAVIGLIIAL